jgi:autotransporter-associated beta strand protein
MIAGSATWKTQPPGSIWNNASSWTPATIPDGPADTATFATSQRRSISPNAPTEVNSIVFSAGGAAFTITSGVGAPLTISGTGIINNSGLTQAFVSPAALSIFLTNGASAGQESAFTNSGAGVSGGLGGLTQFSDTASAGSATFTNNGTSQTGGASGGITELLDDATADQGTFINNGGLATIAAGGMTIFRGNSTAATASFTNNPGAIISFPGEVDFYDNASADHAAFANSGTIVFFNNSTAANGTFTLGGDNGGGVISFTDTSTAADANITLFEDGEIHLQGSASLGNATITANGATDFGFGSSVDLNDTTTADHSTLTANGGIFPGQITSKGDFGFNENATAAEATLIMNPATVTGAVGGTMSFRAGASAGDSDITVNGAAVTGDIAEGILTFSSSDNKTNATAANSTITATSGTNGGKGGDVQFLRNGLGGTCRLALLGNSELDMALDRTLDLTIGSLEGQGTVFLGGHGLIIGSNNLSTLFSGLINDGQGGTVPPGSLSKIGTGTLELSGPAAYTGGTTVNGGTLVVSNKTGSATGIGPVQVNSGTLGGSGIVTGAVTIGNGASSGATLAPAHNTSRPTAFTIQGALTFNTNSNFTFSFKAKGSKAKTDLVTANGVTINSGVNFATQPKTVGTLPLGLVLTVIDNTSTLPIAGTFMGLVEGAILTINGTHFQASYEGGDGNDFTLTVVP